MNNGLNGFPKPARLLQLRKITYGGGNFSIANNSNAGYLEVSSLLRLTVDAQVGDELEYTICGIIAHNAPNFESALDGISIVNDALVNRFGVAPRMAWYAGGTTVAIPLTGSRYHTVVSSDIGSRGRVTIGLVINSGGSSTLYADSTYDLTLTLRNLGPAN